jgi:hypothetical protein
MKIYIPIGSNCETAHYLRKNNMRSLAFPFDWNCASLKSVYTMLVNGFEGFLEDIFIGERVYRLHFEDNEHGETTIDKDFIYPVICKTYSILLPHDYTTIDTTNLVNVKQKYQRRIERFNHYIMRDDIDIFLVYCNINFQLNEWQTSVYTESNVDIAYLQKDNSIYIDKIKELYRGRQNIKVLSIEELSSA